MKLLSVIAFVTLLAALFTLLFTNSLFAHTPLTISIQVVAVLFMLWARVTFGARSFHLAANPTEGGIVTRGPFRVVRHPIYSSILLFTWVGIFDNWSTVNALIGIVILAALLARLLPEEILLRERYPEYADYSRTTKRLIPYLY